jgi:hypothetical protein
MFHVRGRNPLAGPDCPEKDLIDALRGGIREGFSDGLGPKSSFRPMHASRVLG